MTDSVPLQLPLPALKFPIGSEPKEKTAINQQSTSAYISIVESILSLNEIKRIRESFLGPVLRLSDSDMKLSGKIAYAILSRSIVTTKENEVWFHFGAQPMRFSIREFHMVTGLKCSGGVEAPRDGTERFKWDFLKGRKHTLNDVEKQLRSTRSDASDERECLAMLLLVESILLRKSVNGSFPLEYVKKAQDKTYPWGRDAYVVLLNSIKKAVKNHLEEPKKFELQGYPLVFHLWILESIPMLREQFSKRVQPLQVREPVYLCKYYSNVYHPSLDQVLQIEGDPKLKVISILPPIPNDPEDDVFMEDKASDEIESLTDICKKGYKFKAEDWINGYVDTLDVLDALIRMEQNEKTGQTSESIEEDSVNTMVNMIFQVMEENMKSMKDRMFLLEAENIELKARVSELERKLNVAPHTQTQGTQQNDTHSSIGTPVSPMSHEAQVSSRDVERENDTHSSIGTPVSPMSHEAQVFSRDVEREETMNESHASPKSQQIDREQSNNLSKQIEKDPLDDTPPALDTQFFTPNITQQIVRETVETPVLTPIQTQRMVTEGMYEATEPLTETTETTVLTPIQTQQMVTEGTYEATQPLTEILLTNNKKNDTQLLSLTPVSPMTHGKTTETPVLTPIQTQQVVTEETYEATQPLTEIQKTLNDTQPSSVTLVSPMSLETQVFSPNVARENDTQPSSGEQIEAMITEIISTNVSKSTPLTQQTKKAEESKLPTLFENGASVEITTSDDTTTRMWYPGIVVATNLCDGVEKVTVECSTLCADRKIVTVTADKIRPAPPVDDRDREFEMMDNVEVFYSQGWGSGLVKMEVEKKTFSVYCNGSMETIEFKASDLRIHREWIDGVWKIANEAPEGYFKGPLDTQKEKPSQKEHVAEDNLSKKRKVAGSSKDLGMDNVFLRRSGRVPKRSKNTKTPFKSDRNPALTVTPEIIPALDPFSSPAVHKLQSWSSVKSDTTISINGKTRSRKFFHTMEQEKFDIHREHFEAAFAMLNCKRNENAPWFHNYKIPKACFLPIEFLDGLLSHDKGYNKNQKEGQNIFADSLKEVVKGEIYPKKKWGEDVEVVYGATRGKKGSHWIGMAIDLKNRTITLFDCLQTEKNNIDIDIPQVKQLAVLISALLLESSGEEVNKKKVIPFEVEQAQGLPKTKFTYNCGLFIVKVLECHSLKIGDMSKITDDNAPNLRRSLACVIFNQFA